MHRNNLFACSCHIRPLFWPHARAAAPSDARVTRRKNMTSHCKKRRIASLAVSAVLAPAVSAATLPGAQPPRLLMRAYGAARGRRDWPAGQHCAALRQLRTPSVAGLDPRGLADICCVALAMRQRWRAEAAACPNRAVRRGDAHGAPADLGTARALAPRAGFVFTHFAALRSHRTDTRADAS